MAEANNTESEVIETIEVKETPGFMWCFKNKGKIFEFQRTSNKNKKQKLIGRVVGFAEDVAGGYFIVTTRDEPEGKKTLVAVDAEVIELPPEVLADYEKILPRAKKDSFIGYIAPPEHNMHCHNEPVMTPIGRATTR